MRGYFRVGPSISEHSRRLSTPAYAARMSLRSGTNSPNFPELVQNSFHRKGYLLKQSGAPYLGYTWTYLLGRSSTEITNSQGDEVEDITALSFYEPTLLSQSVRDNMAVTHMSFSENDLNALRAKTQKRITDATMELAVSLKELPETIRMMLNGAQRINNLVVAARRKDLSGIADALGISRTRAARDKWKKGLRRAYKSRPGVKNSINGVSGLYLEAVFGWNSAYQEIIAGAEYAASLTAKPPKEKCSASGLTSNFSENKVISNSETNLRFKLDKTTFRRMTAWFNVSWDTVITAAGLNISAIWQVIPYSFIINWFTDVTSFLRQFELLKSLSNLSVTLTQKTVMSLSVTGTIKVPNANGIKVWQGASASFSGEITTRSPTSLYLTFPPVRLPSKTGQYISAFALVVQRITGK